MTSEPTGSPFRMPVRLLMELAEGAAPSRPWPFSNGPSGHAGCYSCARCWTASKDCRRR